MQLSVIICTKDRCADLVPHMVSLKKQTRLPNEVIVVDASVRDAGLIQELLKTYDSTFDKTFYIRALPGLTKQRNIGVKASEGEIIFFFDDDTVLEPEYIEKIMEVFERDEDGQIGGAIGRIKGVSSSKRWGIQWLQKWFYLASSGDGCFKASGLPTWPHWSDKGTNVEAVSGCQMSFRKRIIEKNPFDENLSEYCYMEDDDIGYRVSRHYKIRYVPDALCEHRASPSSRLKRRAVARMLVVNQYYLFRKNISSQSLTYPLAMSFLGHILLSIRLRDWQGLLGTIDGIAAILKGQLPRRETPQRG